METKKTCSDIENIFVCVCAFFIDMVHNNPYGFSVYLFIYVFGPILHTVLFVIYLRYFSCYDEDVYSCINNINQKCNYCIRFSSLHPAIACCGHGFFGKLPLL